jgi:hypothetical protein
MVFILLSLFETKHKISSVAVAFFYSSMSVLEGKPEEAIPRVQAVCPPPFSLSRH